MNWYHSPRTLQALAAAYALGTLAGPARRRFETVLRQQPAAAQAVAQWNRRFAPLAQRLPPAQASAELWQRIEKQAFEQAPGIAAAPAPAARSARTNPRPATQSIPRATAAKPTWMRWLDALLAPAPAAALAMGMMLGLALPLLMSTLRPPAAQETELPESYVGVLATSTGKTGLIVSSLRRGKVLDVKRVGAVEVPPGKTLFLWTLDAQGQAAAIGRLPSGGLCPRASGSGGRDVVQPSGGTGRQHRRRNRHAGAAHRGLGLPWPVRQALAGAGSRCSDAAPRLGCPPIAPRRQDRSPNPSCLQTGGPPWARSGATDVPAD